MFINNARGGSSEKEDINFEQFFADVILGKEERAIAFLKHHKLSNILEIRAPYYIWSINIDIIDERNPDCYQLGSCDLSNLNIL